MANTIDPVPTRSPMLNNDGTAQRVWIQWFSQLVGLAGKVLGLQVAGVTLPQRSNLNFLAPLTAVDNAAADSTDVGLNFNLPFRVQFGKSDQCPRGGISGQVAVTFPTPFETLPIVLCGPDNFPRGGNEPFNCYPTDITLTGFKANFSCSVPTGGGGAEIGDVVHANWVALVLV